ncbi:MAG: hypothetical protein LBV36_00165, partial [Chromatiales bacterium]|nr:hypothetical protein [Chromatiales bacterium]
APPQPPTLERPPQMPRQIAPAAAAHLEAAAAAFETAPALQAALRRLAARGAVRARPDLAGPQTAGAA